MLHFKPRIEGRHVTLFTDHKPLIGAYKKQTSLKSEIQKRNLSIISEYVADVIHIKSNENIVADCLSRPTNTVMVDIFDLPEIAKQQQDDVEIEDYKEKLQSYPLGDLQLYCDTSTFHPRPFVPKDARKPIFDTFHGLSHPGYSATLKLIKSRYFWPGMNKQIRTWTK